MSIAAHVLQYNKATNLLVKGKHEKAISEFKELLRMGGEYREAYLNMGNAYKFLNKDRQAGECYIKATSPSVSYLDEKEQAANGGKDYHLALSNLGLNRFIFGLNDEAIECYDRALAIKPDFSDALWNKSTALLKKACTLGGAELFEEGWKLYENRFKKTPPVTLKCDKEGVMFWKGQHVESLVVLAEQGIGDNIMWGRYLHLLKPYCSKLYVQCDNNMKPLFKDFSTVFSIKDCDAEYAVPMCSLSKFFPGIPNAEWLTGFDAHNFGPGYNIGIVWQGSKTHANDSNRSVAVHRFHRLAKYANLYSLSPGFSGSKYVKSLDIKNWEDTARYVNGLDLVISIDTSLVHLAGSLGCETWMLQPLKETDFRWGSDANGSWNPWYSSVKVYRNPNDWDFVFNMVEADLKERLGV